MDEAALLSEAMLAWFPPLGTVELSTRSNFTESDLRDISHLLCRSGKASWSRIPRIYTTLRLINEIDVIDAFLSCGITDLSLPFNQRTLPGQLKDQLSRVRFLDVQSRVLTKALDLEKENRGYGFVDKVISTISYREYARKLILRGRTFRQDRDVLRDFENELQVLKKLSHHHIVRLIGSYTDPRYVGILMAPVADCNLKALLSTHPLSLDTRSLVRTFYGCLVSALRYLHENELRHKDIKPENVLIKSHAVYLTDFGTTLDWSDLGHSTTTGFASRLTPRYAAPEVATNQPRNTSADIWSLGCVFLEIWTELCDHSVSELLSFMESHGSKSSSYYANISAVMKWCDLLSSGTSNDANVPGPWIRSMLQIDTSARRSIQSLAEEIQTLNYESNIAVSFSGLCCNEGFIATESVVSSDYQASIMKAKERAAVSSAFSSTDTLVSEISQKEFSKSDGAGVCSAVEKANRCLHSGKVEGEQSPQRTEAPVPKQCNGSSKNQRNQRTNEEEHEEIETARYADWSPDVDDEYSRLKSRYKVRQSQSTRYAPSLHDIEVSSPTFHYSSDSLDRRVQRSEDPHFDVGTQRHNTFASDSSSEATYVCDTENLVTPHSRRQKYGKTHEQTGNTIHASFMLKPPLANSERTVNEVIHQWLANFHPSTYRKMMTIEVLEQQSVLMYRLGESRYEPELSSFYRVLVNAYQELGIWAKISHGLFGMRPGNPRFINYFVNIVKDSLYVLDGVHVPYVEREGYFEVVDHLTS
ncbi:unnamed protein product [Alternaria burnsii]|nr:unnamed protein product [Alternaria burnsii]